MKKIKLVSTILVLGLLFSGCEQQNTDQIHNTVKDDTTITQELDETITTVKDTEVKSEINRDNTEYGSKSIDETVKNEDEIKAEEALKYYFKDKTNEILKSYKILDPKTLYADGSFIKPNQIIYKVEIEIINNEGTAWDKGINNRFAFIEKQVDGNWKVISLSTGV
ncbi:MAG TPA: hypothetical protein DEP72_05590 [Clostridiales bacterium]|nr:MAG: hypothetical protein A2Y18_02680 [Clostridiales bacterium GWD2_32_19]HCC07615.1 hypothetical protein [Clostridiales bacterium]